MVIHIKNIIIGWFRKIFKKNNELADKRLKICKNCPHRICLTKNLEICELCGCELDAKSRVEDEICHDGRWNVI